MTPGIWGAFSAVSWGVSDFCARLTGRAAGYVDALLGVLFLGAVFLSLWLGTAVTLIGVVTVARGGAETGPAEPDGEEPVPAATPAPPAAHPAHPAHPVHAAAVALPAPGSRTAGAVWARLLPVKAHTVAGAAVSSLAWAAMISATQKVAPVVGNVQTIWFPRLVAFVLLAVFVGARCLRGRPLPRVPGRWWPVIAAQAGLDVIGYYTLYSAATGPNPEIAAMASSAYYVVTVVFGRIFLKERIGLVQAGGIALVLGGVVLLSA